MLKWLDLVNLLLIDICDRIAYVDQQLYKCLVLRFCLLLNIFHIATVYKYGSDVGWYSSRFKVM